jgi:uncharacterized membrane protein
MTNTIESGIEVNAPVRSVYNQWTQFEEFPRFMKHVKSIRQLGDKHLHWTVELGGRECVFDAEIVEQIPDKRIAWRSTNGLRHSGVVTFHRLADTKTKVMVQLDYDPQGVVEHVGTFFGVPEADLEKDLARFAEFLAKRGVETGGWRGHILAPNERSREKDGREMSGREPGGREPSGRETRSADGR